MIAIQFPPRMDLQACLHWLRFHEVDYSAYDAIPGKGYTFHVADRFYQ